VDYKAVEEKIVYDRLINGLARNEPPGADSKTEPESLFGRVGDRHYKHLTFLTDDCMQVLSAAKNITPYAQINSGSKATNRLAGIVRRFVRKLTFWYVIPQAEQQTVYNNVTYNALEYAQEKQQISIEQLSDVSRKMDKMLKRNEMSDILDAWEHDY